MIPKKEVRGGRTGVEFPQKLWGCGESPDAGGGHAGDRDRPPACDDRGRCQSCDICVQCGSDGKCIAIRVPRVGLARLEPQAVARWGKSGTIGELRRGFIEAAVLEQGYQASEVACFLGCHPSNVSRALQKRGSKV